MSTRFPSSSIWPVAAPPRIAAWIAAAPDGPAALLHHSPGAVYLDVAGQCVGLVGRSAVAHPLTLMTNERGVSSGGARRAYVEAGVLYWGHRALVTRRLVDVRAPRVDPYRTPGTEMSPAAGADVPQFPAAGLVALPDRVTRDTLPAFIGRGDGLTPLGDDVVCGWLAGHRAAGVTTPEVDAVVRRLLPRTTTLSAALLEAAILGEVCRPVADHLRALGTSDSPRARAALVAVGHSSGGGLACGIDLALADLTSRRAAA